MIKKNDKKNDKKLNSFKNAQIIAHFRHLDQSQS